VVTSRPIVAEKAARRPGTDLMLPGRRLEAKQAYEFDFFLDNNG
jgi:hypothetical protein